MPEYKVGDRVKVFAVDGARFSGIPPEGADAVITQTARLKATATYGDRVPHALIFYMADGREADNYHHRFVLPEKEGIEFTRRRAVDRKLKEARVFIDGSTKLSTDQLEAIWEIVETIQ